MTYVLTRTNQYKVIDGTELQYVNIEGECSCGGNRKEECVHVEAVKDFLKKGGKRAPRLAKYLLDQPIPEECPICGGKIDIDISPRCRRRMWVCSSSNAHFWEWLGNGKTKEFLTHNRPNKLGAYYQQSWKDKLKRERRLKSEEHEYFKGIRSNNTDPY